MGGQLLASAVLLGHYRYFAVLRNSSLLSLLHVFREGILRSWCRTLRRIVLNETIDLATA
ncbi:MAG: hypothetical protein ACREA0_04810 [bacterium]